jgi:hypothetical protein
MENKPKICFEITDEQKERALKIIPRGYNLSEKLRIALDGIMDGLEKEEEAKI